MSCRCASYLTLAFCFFSWSEEENGVTETDGGPVRLLRSTLS